MPYFRSEQERIAYIIYTQGIYDAVGIGINLGIQKSDRSSWPYNAGYRDGGGLVKNISDKPFKFDYSLKISDFGDAGGSVKTIADKPFKFDYRLKI
jgi:hypothetical protein